MSILSNIELVITTLNEVRSIIDALPLTSPELVAARAKLDKALDTINGLGI